MAGAPPAMSLETIAASAGTFLAGIWASTSSSWSARAAVDSRNREVRRVRTVFMRINWGCEGMFRTAEPTSDVPRAAHRHLHEPIGLVVVDEPLLDRVELQA